MSADSERPTLRISSDAPEFKFLDFMPDGLPEFVESLVADELDIRILERQGLRLSSRRRSGR